MADAFRRVEKRGDHTTIDLAQKQCYDNNFAIKRGYDAFLEEATASKKKISRGSPHSRMRS